MNLRNAGLFEMYPNASSPNSLAGAIGDSLALESSVERCPQSLHSFGAKLFRTI